MVSSPPLRLERSVLAQLHVSPVAEWADRKDPKEGGEAALTTNVEVLHPSPADHPDRFVVMLLIALAQEEGELAPYRLVHQSVGFFTVLHALENQRDTVTMVARQGATILYSAAREFIVMVTGRGPHGPYLLPTLTFSDLVFEAEGSSSLDEEDTPESPETVTSSRKKKSPPSRKRQGARPRQSR